MRVRVDGEILSLDEEITLAKNRKHSVELVVTRRYRRAPEKMPFLRFTPTTSYVVRNGVLLVTHYQHLIRDEGMSLLEAVRKGSEERLAPILMTALTTGLALIPLVAAGSKPGNEIQSPMGLVILGGLLTSTLLNLVLVPVLFARWGSGR